MDFAKQQLLKFGWSEGKGLGKNEDGIAEAIKPKLKFDTTGVGHDSSEQFTFNWWENVFNNAADNLNVVKSKDGEIKIGLSTEESVNITTKKYSIKHKKKKNNGLEYGSFLKTSKLTSEGLVDHDEKVTHVENEVLKTVNMTDEELLAACGGRTAHKGARHGFKLNGKLSRIEEQDKRFSNLIANNEKISITDEKKLKKKNKEIDIYKESVTEESQDENIVQKRKKINKLKESTEENIETENDNNKEIRKKKKRKRKRDQSSEDENQIEIEAAKKRYEKFCDKKYKKKIKIKRKREEKAFSKISEMFQNCSLEKNEKSDDDGFDETISKKKIKLMNHEETKPTKLKKKSKKEKRRSKKDKNVQKSMDDAGFFELMNEITEKLSTCKELKQKIKEKKKKMDEERISKISEKLKVCKV